MNLLDAIEVQRLVDAGYSQESAIAAVRSGDVSLLVRASRCAHVETFPIGYGTVRCTTCGVAFSVNHEPPYGIRHAIREGDRSASWNEIEAAVSGAEPHRDRLTRPWWSRVILWVSDHFGRS